MVEGTVNAAADAVGGQAGFVGELNRVGLVGFVVEPIAMCFSGDADGHPVMNGLQRFLSLGGEDDAMCGKGVIF